MREKPNYVYVASSWRNPVQAAVCATLRAAGIDHYDFKNPEPGSHGFHWSSVMPSYNHESCDMFEYIAAIQHPIAVEGFGNDFRAMQKADACVLVLPCGRSSHLEMGWFTGQPDKRTAILLDGPQITPELMYKMVDYIAPSLFDLLGWLGVED